MTMAPFGMLVLIAFCSSAAAFLQPRIFGGNEVQTRAEFPYQVSIRDATSLSHFCGGTIIDRTHVLTAASCVFHSGALLPASSIFIVVGDLHLNAPTTTVIRVNVSRIFPNPSFQLPVYHDIAVLRLSDSLNWTRYINSTPLAVSTPIDATRCNISGWGATEFQSNQSSNGLRYATVVTFPREQCLGYANVTDADSLLCAGGLVGGIDALTGDVGGPLVCDNSLAGVISWRNASAVTSRFGIYANVAYYRSWIEAVTISASVSSYFSTSILTVLALLICRFMI